MLIFTLWNESIPYVTKLKVFKKDDLSLNIQKEDSLNDHFIRFLVEQHIW